MRPKIINPGKHLRSTVSLFSAFFVQVMYSYLLVTVTYFTGGGVSFRFRVSFIDSKHLVLAELVGFVPSLLQT